MPASPRDDAGEESQPGPRQEVLYLDHVGNHDNPFAALKHIDTLLLIDDSESMQQCWDEVGDIIRIIAPICMKYDDDGIDIEFVNHRASGYFVTGRSGYKNIGFMKGQLDMHDNVAGIYHSVSPRGKCRMDRRLASILDPYLQEYETQLNRSGGKKLIKPLSVIVISDMDWDADQRDHSAITRVARRLGVLGAPRYQVGVQFFRVGQMGRMMDDEAIQFVDDQIWKKRGVRDMVDITTWTGKPGELSPDGILKVLLGGVRRSIDFMEV
ncbi:putative von willebrand factor protein [Rosellinia necatrix]|uniref:Putative von willebrand factor protein n=1 Tax=Rosellinia necatrix TaxID=77044 RepID=A0A1W2TFA4_ROSNE|nr:putative von willebrand factor protein [Rosellinia necatrix]